MKEYFISYDSQDKYIYIIIIIMFIRDSIFTCASSDFAE